MKTAKTLIERLSELLGIDSIITGLTIDKKAASLQNNWTDDPIYPSVIYFKVNNIVYLQGVARKDVAGTGVIFNLPVGYRPAGILRFSVFFNNPTAYTNQYLCTIQISPNGDVSLLLFNDNPESKSVDLSSISFAL